jgi:TPR repeat protein
MMIFSCSTMGVENKSVSRPVRSLYEQYITAAEAGEVEAQVKIGISYEEGLGVSIDYDEAYRWFKMASLKGNNEAYYRIARFYEYGLSVDQNDENAFEWYLSSASTGFIPAIHWMMQYYEDQQAEQLIWINQGMEYDDPFSYFRYALLLEKTDTDESLNYFIKGKDSEDIEARGILSILTLNGTYPFYKNAEAIEYLKVASLNGYSRCQVFLGWLSEFGIFLPPDTKLAFSLYESAARNYDILAIYNLSRFYSEGIFVKEDSHLANRFFMQIPEDFNSPVAQDLEKLAVKIGDDAQQIILYRFRVLNNDVDAMHHLGLLLDSEDAFQWFLMASEAEHPGAMRELAKLYIDEKSLNYDPVKGAAWLMTAENLTGIRDKDFSSSVIMKNMSDQEKLEVSQLFTDFFYTSKRGASERNLVR